MGVASKLFRKLIWAEGTHPYVGFFMSAASFIVGLLCLVLSYTESAPFPDAAKAIRVSGEIRELESQLWETNFRISGRAELFVYSDKMGELGFVTKALKNAKTLDLLVVPKEHVRKYVESSKRRLDVISIVADGKSIRSEAESKVSWDQGNETFKWVAAPAMALLFWCVAYISFQIGLEELNRKSR
jgi:hypothetical protein